jgi:2-methylaconitate cis-trans-isomerase PrpF
VVRELLRRPVGSGGPLRIGHPGGTAAITVTPADGGRAGAAALRYVRTARRLLEGIGFVPPAGSPTP